MAGVGTHTPGAGDQPTSLKNFFRLFNKKHGPRPSTSWRTAIILSGTTATRRATAR